MCYFSSIYARKIANQHFRVKWILKKKMVIQSSARVRRTKLVWVKGKLPILRARDLRAMPEPSGGRDGWAKPRR